MTKEEIINLLERKYELFGNFMLLLNEEDFKYTSGEKWNGGQQLDHLIRSVSPLSFGLRLPGFMLKMLFGKANRPSRTYEDLVKKYQLKLKDGGKASGQFIPNEISFDDKKRKVAELYSKINQLSNNIKRYKENQLD